MPLVDAQLPSFLVGKLCAEYPNLNARNAELVLYGLRQFFMAHLRSGRKFVAMPSKIVDNAWHEFILHTRAYDIWCHTAFGQLLHHSPAEVLGKDARRNDGLRRSWYWACKKESIDPKKPARLLLLFALDKKFDVPGGFSYLPDCNAADRHAGSDAHCGTGFGDGCEGSAAGDAGGFGGSESGGDGGSGCGGRRGLRGRLIEAPPPSFPPADPIGASARAAVTRSMRTKRLKSSRTPRQACWCQASAALRTTSAQSPLSCPNCGNTVPSPSDSRPALA
ncbi:MAG: hypothetical protein ABI589_05490 [Burkholderiales bacterium]